MRLPQIAGIIMLGAFIISVAIAAYRTGGWKHATIAAGGLCLIAGVSLLFP